MRTSIEWADYTWNPYTWACHKVSEGCQNCYMMAMAKRFGKGSGVGEPSIRKHAWRELNKFDDGAVIFVNSMSDTYHESVGLKTIHSIHQTAIDNPQYIFLILTKRIERVYYMRDLLAFPDNLWIGTSIESQKYLWRLSYLSKIPSAGRFVSAEPLIGAIEFTSHPAFIHGRVNWVIAGAESGSDRRPFNENWVRRIRNDCIRHHVPFMYKQGSAFKSGQNRILDGRTWDESPFHQQSKSVAPSTIQKSFDGREV